MTTNDQDRPRVESDLTGWTIRLDFERDDPHGAITAALTRTDLERMLAALGDPMPLGEARADDAEAAEQLRSVSRITEQLTRRQDALIVALRERGTSWTGLAALVEDAETDPRRLRSAMQRRYETALRRMGLHPIAGGSFYRGQRVRVVAVGDSGRADLIGRVGVVQAETRDGRITVSGLSGRGRETFADYLAFGADEIVPQTPEADEMPEAEARAFARIVAAFGSGDRATAERLVDRLLSQSADPAATEARLQAAIRQATGV